MSKLCFWVKFVYKNYTYSTIIFIIFLFEVCKKIALRKLKKEFFDFSDTKNRSLFVF